jgi:hypothetical protein
VGEGRQRESAAGRGPAQAPAGPAEKLPNKANSNGKRGPGALTPGPDGFDGSSALRP